MLASKQAHCEVDCVHFHPHAFSQSLNDQFFHFGIDFRPELFKAEHQAREEEQESLGDGVVGCAVDVSASFQDLQDPGEGWRELGAAVVLEEEG